MIVNFEVPGVISGKSRPKFFTGALKSVILNALKSLRDRSVGIVETATDAGDAAAQIRELSLFARDSKFDGNPAPYVHAYTPSETKEMETHVRTFAKAAMQGRPPMEGPIWLYVHTQQNPPVSWSKRKKAETYFVTSKPDADNVLKLIMDALNGVCWTDDAQVPVFLMGRTYTDGPEIASISTGRLLTSELPIARPNFMPATMPMFPGMA